MYLTEEEANTKWCFKSIDEEGNGSFNRFSPAPHKETDEPRFPLSCRCIASRCMAWRWFVDDGVTRRIPDPIGKGFCGLAEKP